MRLKKKMKKQIMKNDKLNEQEKKKLIDKFENKKKNDSFTQKKEMYLKQTDRNYKDGDRN